MLRVVGIAGADTVEHEADGLLYAGVHRAGDAALEKIIIILRHGRVKHGSRLPATSCRGAPGPHPSHARELAAPVHRPGRNPALCAWSRYPYSGSWCGGRIFEESERGREESLAPLIEIFSNDDGKVPDLRRRAPGGDGRFPERRIRHRRYYSGGSGRRMNSTGRIATAGLSKRPGSRAAAAS